MTSSLAFPISPYLLLKKGQLVAINQAYVSRIPNSDVKAFYRKRSSCVMVVERIEGGYNGKKYRTTLRCLKGTCHRIHGNGKLLELSKEGYGPNLTNGSLLLTTKRVQCHSCNTFDWGALTCNQHSFCLACIADEWLVPPYRYGVGVGRCCYAKEPCGDSARSLFSASEIRTTLTSLIRAENKLKEAKANEQ